MKRFEKDEGPHPVDVHVGARLRLRRHLLGMSQDQLGRAIGLTFQQVQKYERGANRMSASRLYDFARIMDVPITYFFEEMEEGSAQTVMGFAEKEQTPLEDEALAEKEMLRRRETLEMIRAYYRLKDRKTRRKLYEMIKAMVQIQDADITES
ncbi:MAG: helix-turn-helix transcriptional regulator [Alphaproteobacteria bacterium]|nr:helix-turn-helix transcriptional regulator [Alphaproteobacteria bacterium]